MYQILTHGIVFTTVNKRSIALKICSNLIKNDVITEVTIKKL